MQHGRRRPDIDHLDLGPGSSQGAPVSSAPSPVSQCAASRRLTRPLADDGLGRATSAPDPPALAPAPPGRSRSLRTVDRRARRSSKAGALELTADARARV
jgi:hypothetical protein